MHHFTRKHKCHCKIPGLLDYTQHRVDPTGTEQQTGRAPVNMDVFRPSDGIKPIETGFKSQ